MSMKSGFNKWPFPFEALGYVCVKRIGIIIRLLTKGAVNS